MPPEVGVEQIRRTKDRKRFQSLSSLPEMCISGESPAARPFVSLKFPVWNITPKTGLFLETPRHDPFHVIPLHQHE